MTDLTESRVYRQRWLTLVTIALSVLFIVLDATVMNVALPTIQRELNATATQLLWMVNAYTMMLGALMLTTGSLGDRFGRARFLQIGVLVFGLSSVGAYFSNSPNVLIIWRLIMGAGAALIMPTTLAIITNVFPEKERGQAIGVWAGLNSVGIALGPIIGGALVQHFRWNSIFLINIPVAVVALTMGLLFVPNSKDSHPRKLDLPGNILALAGLAALIYGLINGGSKGWTDAQVLGTLIGSAAILLIFVLWERRTSHPLMEMSFFRDRQFTSGVSVIMILGLGLNGFQYVLTYYMQFVKSYSALATGIRYLPLAGGLLVGAITSDSIARKIGPKITVLLGFIGSATMLIIFSFLKIDSPFWNVGVNLGLESLFLGIIVTPVTNMIMGALPKDKAGIGSALNSVFRMVTGAIGVALLGSIIDSIYTSNFSRSAALISGLPAALAQKASDSIGTALGIAASGQVPAPAAMSLAQAARQSFMDGWQLMALISAGFFIAGIILVLIVMPSKMEEQPKE